MNSPARAKAKLRTNRRITEVRSLLSCGCLSLPVTFGRLSYPPRDVPSPEGAGQGGVIYSKAGTDQSGPGMIEMENRTWQFAVTWRGGRVAEGAPLLREYGVYSLIEGSNPSLSANLKEDLQSPL
jgi:hypothetical protein